MLFRLLAILLSLIYSLNSYAQNTIYWQTYHRPPAAFTTGEYQGQGFAQQILTLIINQMPNYKHEIVVTTLARAVADIKANKYSCHPALIETKQRKEFMLFSQASLLNPTGRIIGQVNLIKPFLENGKVNLTKLLQQSPLTLAHINKRSYGQKIDNILKNNLNDRQIFQVQDIELTRVFKMIERKRLDFVIAYPHEISYYINNNVSTNRLGIYQIAGIPAYTLSSVACPKTPWGQQAISDINQALRKIKPTKAYQNALLAWREEEAKHAHFQQFYQYFIEH